MYLKINFPKIYEKDTAVTRRGSDVGVTKRLAGKPIIWVLGG